MSLQKGLILIQQHPNGAACRSAFGGLICIRAARSLKEFLCLNRLSIHQVRPAPGHGRMVLFGTQIPNFTLQMQPAVRPMHPVCVHGDVPLSP